MDLSHYLVRLLAAQTRSDCDNLYQNFYSGAQANPSQILPAADIPSLITAINGGDPPYVKSYCLLGLGAILDACTITKPLAASVSKAILDLLSTLKNFDVFDERGRYIHAFGHALYLAESLMAHIPDQPETKTNLISALVDCYSRSDQVHRCSADVHLGSILQNFVTDASFANHLMASLEPADITGAPDREGFLIHELNKRLLWMSLRLQSGGEGGLFHSATNPLHEKFLTSF